MYGQARDWDREILSLLWLVRSQGPAPDAPGVT